MGNLTVAADLEGSRPATFREAGNVGGVGWPGKVSIVYKVVNRIPVKFFPVKFPEISGGQLGDSGRRPDCENIAPGAPGAARL